ncbi:hypothetical protein Cgig2_025048 [Carnegiea gigantea]|uniref:Uncharacterized protein n=1 Tax=Carnegiea gigantea TaxID=171969 RepID=A0A9Q1Q4Y4_9CARY|nr:hypothetical protein Cgig2_025048 [Carnegiea gigantea]
MSAHGHDDESDSNDEVLVKRIKKIKEASKSRLKQIQMRSKKCARAQADKERQAIQKSPKSPKSSKQHANPTICVQDPKYVQSMPKPGEVDTKPKKIFQTKMSPSGFVVMIKNFKEAQRQAICNMGFEGFLHLQKGVESARWDPKAQPNATAHIEPG